MTLEEAVFTVFDFETTGLYPYSGDRICEIGAVRFGIRSRKPETFHSLINPQRYISPDAFRVNGISDAMVRGKPAIDKILPDFLKFIKGSVLVAYNAPFDVGFLEAALGDDAHALEDYYIIDALRLARRIFPSIGRYGLGSVAGELDIEIGDEHRALADAMMTWKVFKKEIAVLRSEGARMVEDVDRFLGRRIPALSLADDRNAELVKDAIRLNKELDIIYRSSWSSRSTKRTITPKKIGRGYGCLYVKAYCHLRKEERTFRLDCIMKADMV